MPSKLDSFFFQWGKKKKVENACKTYIMHTNKSYLLFIIMVHYCYLNAFCLPKGLCSNNNFSCFFLFTLLLFCFISILKIINIYIICFVFIVCLFSHSFDDGSRLFGSLFFSYFQFPFLWHMCTLRTHFFFNSSYSLFWMEHKNVLVSFFVVDIVCVHLSPLLPQKYRASTNNKHMMRYP